MVQTQVECSVKLVWFDFKLGENLMSKNNSQGKKALILLQFNNFKFWESGFSNLIFKLLYL